MAAPAGLPYDNFMSKLPALGAVLVAAAVATPASASPFVTTARQDGDTQVGVESSYVNQNVTNKAPLRFEAYAEYALLPDVSVYEHLPMSAGDNGNGGTTAGVGAFEAGASYNFPASDNLKIIASLGIGLPTASDSLDGGFANVGAAPSRYTDVALIQPDQLMVRPLVTGLYHREQLLAQADFGADFGAGVSNNATNMSPLLRFNAAVGADLGPAIVAGEFNLFYNTDSNKVDNTGTSVAVSARGHFAELSPYLAVVIPLDSSTRDQLGVRFAVTAGLEYRLPKR